VDLPEDGLLLPRASPFINGGVEPPDPGCLSDEARGTARWLVECDERVNRRETDAVAVDVAVSATADGDRGKNVGRCTFFGADDCSDCRGG